MKTHSTITGPALRALIRQGKISLGGNKRLRIYGRLNCRSGKRMNIDNRIFFTTEEEAVQSGFRPCGHCLPVAYKNWKMNLFANEEIVNLLPYDGIAHYYGNLMNETEAAGYLAKLFHTIEWKNDEAVLFGKHIVTKRKAAWYGDSGFLYTYSNTTKKALPWTKELLALKELIEQKTGSRFNSCLLNLYHSGEEGMAWHSDDEKSLGKDTAIASLSFGATRKFSFKHKHTKETLSFMLESGSLLVMKGATQTNWLHSLPKSTVIKHPRINLTFRTIVHQY